jgi:Flp pilus assembly protein TadD
MQGWYGESQEQHFATAIHAAQSDVAGANDMLLVAINNEANPGIARGTALSLLRGPYSQSVATTIQRSLENADPFVRVGALRALPSLQPELRVQWGGPLLADPLRMVRIEAARVISPVRSVLHLRFGAAFRDAEIELIDALQAISERSEAHGNLGTHYIGSGDFAAAETEFLTALRLNPGAVGSRANLADLYRQQNRDDDAEQVIRAGLEANADNAALRHSLGLLMVRSEQQALALSELEAAASLQPENPRFVYVYGVALNSLGQTDKAIDVLTAAAESFPADFDIHWGLTTILRDTGRIEDARDVAAGMLQRYPEIESVQNLAQSL